VKWQQNHTFYLTDKCETSRMEKFSNVIVGQYKRLSDNNSALVISNTNENLVQFETLTSFSFYESNSRLKWHSENTALLRIAFENRFQGLQLFKTGFAMFSDYVILMLSKQTKIFKWI
jgi:hypothetical protein